MRSRGCSFFILPLHFHTWVETSYFLLSRYDAEMDRTGYNNIVLRIKEIFLNFLNFLRKIFKLSINQFISSPDRYLLNKYHVPCILVGTADIDR